MNSQISFVLNFADAETPQKFGVPGSFRYVLAQAPSPPVSLQLFRNGVLQVNGVDYTLSGQIITPLNQWDDLDVILCFYRF